MRFAFHSRGTTRDIDETSFGMLFTRSANSRVVFDKVADRVA
ncbi:MAG: hypothetical protein QOD31_2572 [Pseudonocardiales bacterium]|jgi:hypothetical protein|nr:hypothetical protein [Pseudonocardiales bacterium]